MTTDAVHVTNRGEGFEQALGQTQAAARYRALTEKQALHRESPREGLGRP